MTKEEFEAQYAKRSKMLVDQLHKLGLYGRPCDCNSTGCSGWKMVSVRIPMLIKDH